MSRTSLLLCAGAAAAALHAQQPVWTRGTPFPPAGTPSLCFDERRERAVLVLADQTWQFDGAAWTLGSAQHAPGDRGWPALAFDRGRGATWLFGGYLWSLAGSAPQNDLWTWDGTAWTAVTAPAAPRPAPRYDVPLVHDTARDRLVLYGGRTAGGYANDTWEFDGAAWTQASPTSTPTSRYAHEMVYDLARGVTVLFGGLDATLANALAETWEWNGTDWTLRTPASSPSPRYAAGLAYDQRNARVLLHGGRNGSTYPNDTWAYDGSTWTPLPTGGTAAPTEVPTRLCFDPARAEAITARSRAGGLSTWAFDGTSWRSVVQDPHPGPRDHHALAYDPARSAGVMFGGGLGGFGLGYYHDTWEYRGGTWRRVPTATLPPAREDPGLAYDPVNAALLLFGGAGTFSSDLWLFDGTDWTARHPAVLPPPRVRHAMATDTARNRVVLFGGGSGFVLLGDTWEWNGAVWSQRQPTNAPSPRASAGMTYDAVRQRTVLYGGGDLTYGPPRTDHWEWDGTSWTLRSASAAPGRRAAPGLAFDAHRGAVLLHGGYDTMFSLPLPRNDLWLWDGISWTAQAVASPPPTRQHGPLFFDTGIARTVLFSGDLRSDEWLLGPASAAAVTGYGAGCPGAFGLPHLRARGLPVQGNRWFGFELSSLAPGAFAVLGVSTVPQNVPLGGGCAVLVDGPLWWWGLADPRGHREFDLPIPDTPAVRGAALFAQAAALDPRGAFAGLLVASGGLRVGLDR
ncbi:MAG: hypothetical protein FJ265_13155 [Planctomycetes bacterium]|nr:hypothetical protein [Planctomycetota bacterium]